MSLLVVAPHAHALISQATVLLEQIAICANTLYLFWWKCSKLRHHLRFCFEGTLELAELEAIFTQAQMRLSRQSGLTTTAMPSSFSSFPSSVRVPSSGPVRHHDDETEDGRLPPPPPRAPLAPSVPPSTQGAHGGDHHSDQTLSHNNIIDLTDDSSPVGIGMPTSSRSSSVIIPSCKGAKEGIMHNRKRPALEGRSTALAIVKVVMVFLRHLVLLL